MTQDDRRLTNEAGQRLMSAEMDIEVSTESVTEHTHYCCTPCTLCAVVTLHNNTVQYSVQTLALLHRHLGIFTIFRHFGIIATGDWKKKTDKYKQAKNARWTNCII